MDPTCKIKKFFHLLTKTTTELPEDIQIEITNRCNFSCPICPRKLIKAPYQDMPWVRFQKIIEKIGNPKTIVLTGWGEPLIHNDFVHMVAFVNRKLPKTKIKFTTNGSLLNAQLLRSLQKLQIEEIAFSLDAIHRKSSQDQNTKKLLDNLKLLSKGGQKIRPRLNFQTLMSTQGLKDIKPILIFAHCQGIERVNLMRLVKIFDRDLARPSFLEERKIIKKAKKISQRLKTQVQSLNTFHLFRQIASHCDRICLKADDHIYITLEGNVTPCCNLRNQNCGNILKEELKQIWQGQKFRKLRKKRPKICARCDALTWKQKIQ